METEELNAARNHGAATTEEMQPTAALGHGFAEVQPARGPNLRTAERHFAPAARETCARPRRRRVNPVRSEVPPLMDCGRKRGSPLGQTPLSASRRPSKSL
ncbi:hypothetical protein HPB50_015396 [Hyalomma asiaticum]|uniref:Uncharacterized protein n=1 Tax=Hyalomma asiaticum TaxID=266040 RepID=A0ACB7TKZ2_HYAAI|nr:hypothetical protein HPB50_015396 [Hyalomma asiaticum]